MICCAIAAKCIDKYIELQLQAVEPKEDDPEVDPIMKERLSVIVEEMFERCLSGPCPCARANFRTLAQCCTAAYSHTAACAATPCHPFGNALSFKRPRLARTSQQALTLASTRVRR